MRKCYKKEALRSKRERKTTKHKQRKAKEPQGKFVQLPFGSAELLELIRDDLQQLMLDAGTAIAEQLLRDEVERLCGSRYQRAEDREYVRYGQQRGAIVLSGQKIRLKRPRVRSKAGHGEAKLKTYEAIQAAGDAMPIAVQKRLIRGVSCRDYRGVIDATMAGFGISKSSVSRSFIRGSKKRLRELLERRFEGERFVVVYIDGIEFAGETLIVALGVMPDGKKRVLGLRQGATENSSVVTALLSDLVERGLDVEQPTLLVLDGSKALYKAVRKIWGTWALVQRCQAHKKRNVIAHLPEKHLVAVEKRLTDAYHAKTYRDALQILKNTVKWLRRIAPDAAGSLEEGLEETLTVLRLGIPELLAKSLVTTNPIESAFSVVTKLTRRVKRYQDGDMRCRWCAAGLLRAEAAFHRINGYADLSVLIKALEKECATNQVDSLSQAA